jgi:hypothetical protein
LPKNERHEFYRSTFVIIFSFPDYLRRFVADVVTARQQAASHGQDGGVELNVEHKREKHGFFGNIV